jgi:acetyltransferase-like isoleucine patch superfamily enzyme
MIGLRQSLRVLIFRAVSDCRPNGKPILRQPVQFVGRGHIILGEAVSFGVFPSPGYLNSYGYLEARSPRSSISIGPRTQINNNFCAIAEYTQIEIGSDCLIGMNVEILDSDFHAIDVKLRHTSPPDAAKAVYIENNVFIGAHTKILKGVHIGRNSVIAAGSIVTSNIPADAIAAGNPARVIKMI